jgi:hypothetical protein
MNGGNNLLKQFGQFKAQWKAYKGVHEPSPDMLEEISNDERHAYEEYSHHNYR